MEIHLTFPDWRGMPVGVPTIRRFRRMIPVLVGPLVGGCGTDPDDLGRCAPPLAITVTQSPLTFAWGPTACDVHTLTVIQGNTINIKWHIAANTARNSIGSPVRYGVPPSNVDASNADTLVAGPYTVRLTRLNSEGTALEISDKDFSFSGD